MLFLLAIAALSLIASPAAAQGQGSLFAAGKTNDIAAAVLDFVFHGRTEIFDSTAAKSLYDGLRALFGYYSGAVLVVAVFIVIYHLVVMVGESAHYGVPFGKRNKQMWAPVRLVLALGLLVPVNGFNCAQFMMMQMARWGSGLASNAWESFAGGNQFRKLTLHGSAAVDPTATVANLVAIGICAKSFEIVGSAAPERLSPIVMKEGFFKVDVEQGKPVSRVLYRTNLAEAPDTPIGCGSLTWLERDPLQENTAIGKITAMFAGAHLEAVKKIQTDALNLGGRLALGSVGVISGEHISTAGEFARLTAAYQAQFLETLRTSGLDLNPNNTFNVISKEDSGLADSLGWLSAGAMLQKFALTDTALITPELAAPVVGFTYPLQAGVSLRATAQIARALGLTRILMQPYDPKAPASIWFNPAIDHNKGPFKQSLILAANILARETSDPASRNILDPGISADKSSSIGLFRPIALGMRSLDLADQFLAVAEWSPRANSPVFGPSILFGNLLQTVAQAYYALAPRAEAADFPPQLADSPDRPADLARWLMGAFAAALFIPGLLLVFVLPLLPLIKFAVGGVLWLLSIMQGLAAAPVWAMTFLSLRGDDMMPQTSRLGMILIFNIFLRPILMVIGFLAAIVLMHMGFGLLQVFLEIFSYDGLQGSRTLYSLGSLALLIADLILSFGIANASLKCIDLLPETVLHWLGASAMGGAGGEDGSSGEAMAQSAATGGSGGGASGVLAASIVGGGSPGQQQTWQRNVLNVLEQIAVQGGGDRQNNTMMNAGMFPQMPDRPDLMHTHGEKPGPAGPPAAAAPSWFGGPGPAGAGEPPVTVVTAPSPNEMAKHMGRDDVRPAKEDQAGEDSESSLEKEKKAKGEAKEQETEPVRAQEEKPE